MGDKRNDGIYPIHPCILSSKFNLETGTKFVTGSGQNEWLWLFLSFAITIYVSVLDKLFPPSYLGVRNIKKLDVVAIGCVSNQRFHLSFYTQIRSWKIICTELMFISQIFYSIKKKTVYYGHVLNRFHITKVSILH